MCFIISIINQVHTLIFWICLYLILVANWSPSTQRPHITFQGRDYASWLATLHSIKVETRPPCQALTVKHIGSVSSKLSLPAQIAYWVPRREQIWTTGACPSATPSVLPIIHLGLGHQPIPQLTAVRGHLWLSQVADQRLYRGKDKKS